MKHRKDTRFVMEINIKQKGMLYAYEDTLDKLNKIDS